MKQVLVVCVALAACVWGQGVWGQCGEWDSAGMPAVPVGYVGGVVAWDPDGVGPTPEWLVVESNAQVGDLITTIAAWDGAEWHDLRPNSLQSLRPLCSFGNDLIAVLPGVTTIDPSFVVRVHADRSMTVIGDSRVMPVPSSAVSDGSLAYFFGSTGTLPPYTRWCGRYDGSNWTTIPADFGAGSGGVSFLSKVLWNGQLVVTGNFTSINGQPIDRVAVWDGSEWAGFTTFPRTNVALTAGVFQDQLFVTGDLHPMRWTGNGWQVPALEAFPAGQWPPSGMPTYVVYSQNGVYLPQWGRKYDGVTWVPYDTGLMTMPLRSLEWRGNPVLLNATAIRVIEDDVTVPLTGGLTGEPLAACAWEGHLVVAGIAGAGRARATPAVIWDGTEWHNIGTSPPQWGYGYANVTSVTPFESGLLLGQAASQPQTIQGLWLYDSAGWRQWPSSPWNSVYSIAVLGGEPVVLGTYGNVRHLARWTGVAWEDIVQPQEAIGISGIAADAGRLYIAGTFTQIGGIQANKVAAWDGESWSGFGAGPPFASRIGVYRGHPVVGSAACSWWDGTTWVNVPPHTSNTDAFSFAELNGDLITGSQPFRWSPESGTRPLGSDEGQTQGSVRLGVVAGGHLFLAGSIYRAGDRSVAFCAEWSDTNRCDCDSIDFNRDNLFPDIADIPDFLSVFQGGLCARQSPTAEGPCNGDIDFNNDGLFPDTLDIQAFLSVFSGGECVQ